MGGTRKPRWEEETPAGPELGYVVAARLGPPVSFDPSDQSRKRILHKKGRSAKPVVSARFIPQKGQGRLFPLAMELAGLGCMLIGSSMLESFSREM